jgi:hypothetical protein
MVHVASVGATLALVNLVSASGDFIAAESLMLACFTG